MTPSTIPNFSLINACKENNLEFIINIFNNLNNLNEVIWAEDGVTPLMIAIEKKHYDIVKYLIIKGNEHSIIFHNSNKNSLKRLLYESICVFNPYVIHDIFNELIVLVDNNISLT